MRKHKILLVTLLALTLCLTSTLTASAEINKPNLVEPEDGFATSANELNFKWESLENAENYRIQIVEGTETPIGGDTVAIEENSSDNNISIDLSSLEGEYRWQVRGENGDNTGNESEYSLTIDGTGPEISGVEASVEDDSSALIEWDSIDDDVVSVKTAEIHWGTTEDFSEDPVPITDFGGGSEELTGLSAGTVYYYEVWAKDNVGNENSVSGSFETMSPPDSSVHALENYWQVVENFEVMASASDEDGNVENVSLFYNFKENTSAEWDDDWENYGFGSPVSENSENWVWDFACPENDGFYQLRTQAVDNDGLVESSSDADEELGVDTLAPEVLSIEIDGDNTVTTEPSVNISVDAEDETSGLDQIRFRIDNQEWKDWKSFVSENNHYFLPPYGMRVIHVQVKDVASLTSPVESDWILLENATFTKPVGDVDENENKSADISNWGLIVENVTLCAENNISNTEIGLREENEKPAEIPIEKPTDIVRKYFQIETNCGVENFKKFYIDFTLENSWLNEQELEPDEIEVWRFDNDWEEVEVKMVSENGTHYNYRVTTSKLSWFAITENTGRGLWVYILIIGIAAAGVILFYLYGWEEVKPYLESSGRSRGGGSGGLPS